LELHPVIEETKELAHKLSELALSYRDSGRAILIFVRTIDDLKRVSDKLPRDRTSQLTGTMRGFEREALINEPIFKRFLPEAEIADQTVYLVCTSAGEVGVNISADHLVCDLSTFESMAQRFGRVNRFGLRDDTTIHVVHPTEFDENPLEPQREKTLALLNQLNGDGSPDSLASLDPAARADAFAPRPTELSTSDILFDAWGMTSIRDPMPGRPPVEPYLHGIRDYDPPETQVAWREEVGKIIGGLLDEYRPRDLLDEYPVKPHELLGDRTDRVWKEIVKLSERLPQAPIWVVDWAGDVVPTSLQRISEKDGKRFIEWKTVLLPHDVGGLTKQGMLDGSTAPLEIETDKGSSVISNDVADALTLANGQLLRQRIWTKDKEANFDYKAEGMRLVTRVDFEPGEDDDDVERSSWYWFELAPIPNENSKNAAGPVLLDVHVSDVVKRVMQILSNLTLHSDSGYDAKLKHAIVVAAMRHDLGKRREPWQRSIGRPAKFFEKWFAKSGPRWRSRDTTLYRHEFGSLLDLQSLPEFQALDDESQDLVQHLIATHHGQGRPHFAAEQVIDQNFTSRECDALAIEVPRRFARLQRRYGRWGLAYLESLIRAADWSASASPSEFFTENSV
jgi:CRISPR-associated endonuclease/helicase Cas3